MMEQQTGTLRQRIAHAKAQRAHIIDMVSMGEAECVTCRAARYAVTFVIVGAVGYTAYRIVKRKGADRGGV